jgi:hypothetical protein
MRTYRHGPASGPFFAEDRVPSNAAAGRLWAKTGLSDRYNEIEPNTLPTR